MPPWLFYTLGGLFAGFGVFVGLLMFLSPPRFRRFNAWWSRADEWSVARSEEVPQASESGTRLAGLGLAAVFAFMLRPMLAGLFHVIRGSEPTPRIVEPVAGGARSSGGWETWSRFIPGPMLVAAGLWLLLWPEAHVARIAASWPERVIPESTRVRQILVTRILGVIMLFAGLYLLWNAFGHLRS
jgi:hypothetical protein